MHAFFKHKKFWLPLTVLLVLFLVTEILLRLGLYDIWIKPKSFLGNAIYREHAVKQSGLDEIQWIAVGSSRIDWGINHKKFTEALEKIGVNYKRMSFESSNFIATQATISWSIDNMKNLDGIILGVTEEELSKLFSLSKQYKIAWPFKSYIDLENFQVRYNTSKWEKYFYQLAWVNYFADIKSLFQNPVIRFNQIRVAKNTNTLIEKHHNPNNLCEYDVSTLQSCVDIVPNININDKRYYGYKILKTICSKPNSIARAKNNKPMAIESNAQILLENWSALINFVLQKEKHLILVLMPEHETHEYIFKPSNASEITQSIIDKVKINENFNVIDLRNIFEGQNDCQFFSDPLHLNNQGIKKFTNQLLKSFKNSLSAQQKSSI